jgi:hypothetical protein
MSPLVSTRHPFSAHAASVERAPATTRLMRANLMAYAHITQGSTLV